ncbi:hypothetical protein [Streptomyces sp. MBT84]|nr:hypothetical protein [Streptomyces sp. MBT84]
MLLLLFGATRRPIRRAAKRPVIALPAATPPPQVAPRSGTFFTL